MVITLPGDRMTLGGNVLAKPVLSSNKEMPFF